MPARDRDAVRAGCARSLSGHGLRTVRPAAVLRALAARADDELEPDVYGEGPVIARFEQRVSAVLGTEAAAFMPSGTMAQQIALRIHADRRGPRSVAFHPRSHLEVHEHKAYQLLHGLHGRHVGDPNRVLGRADLDAVREPLAALLLELPQRDLGGRLPSWEELEACVAWARERGVALHLDGARLWQATPFYGRPPAAIAGLFDTVYVSFYKDLGGLAGCALAGPTDVIAEARVWQARHGGRVRSLWPYVLTAESGLDERLPRMGDYHARAVAVAAALRDLPELEVVPDPPQATMFHLFLRGDAERLDAAALEVAAEHGVWLGSGFGATPLPGWQRLEVSIGEAAMEVGDAEVRSLFEELLERSRAGAAFSVTP